MPLKSGGHPQQLALLGVLFLGFVLGLIYVFLVPPWQHYDEPGQFEYAWLYANEMDTLQRGDYNQQMRREVAASMLEHGFFKDVEFKPYLFSQTSPVSIGISQVGDQPLYFWIISLPLRLFNYLDITSQLYIARITSLFLFLIFLGISGGFLAEISNRRVLLWLVPLTIVLIPGVVDIMTAVNNDVGAVLFFTLFLWGSARLIRRGYSLLNILWLIIAAVLCYYTKITVWVAIPLSLLVGLFALFREKYRWGPWVIVSIATVFSIIATFGWGNAATWTNFYYQPEPTRHAINDDIDNKYVLSLYLIPERSQQMLLQSYSPQIRTLIKGKQVAIDGSAQSTKPVILHIGFNSGSGWKEQKQITVGRNDTPFNVKLTIPEDAQNVWLQFNANLKNKNEPAWLYLDDLSMSLVNENSGSLEQPGGNSPSTLSTNFVANPFADQGWLRIRPAAFNFLSRFIYSNLNIALSSLSNLPNTAWYYQSTLRYLLQTFWGNFGWGNVPLIGLFTYQILAILTTLGILGGMFLLIRERKRINWRILFILFIVIAFLWLQTIFRGVSSIFGSIWLPAARYALPAIVPTVLVLSAGWFAWVRLVSKGSDTLKYCGFLVYIAFFTGLNTLAILTLWEHYYL